MITWRRNLTISNKCHIWWHLRWYVVCYNWCIISINYILSHVQSHPAATLLYLSRCTVNTHDKNMKISNYVLTVYRQMAFRCARLRIHSAFTFRIPPTAKPASTRERMKQIRCNTLLQPLSSTVLLWFWFTMYCLQFSFQFSFDVNSLFWHGFHSRLCNLNLISLNQTAMTGHCSLHAVQPCNNLVSVQHRPPTTSSHVCLLSSENMHFLLLALTLGTIYRMN